MPNNTEFDARDRAHVFIDAFRDTLNYSPRPPRPGSPKPLRDDYPAHAANLLRQLDAALQVGHAIQAPLIQTAERGTMV